MHEHLCSRTTAALSNWLYKSLKGFSLELHYQRLWRFNFISQDHLQELIGIIIDHQFYQGDPISRCLPLENHIYLAGDHRADFLYSMEDCVLFMNSRMLLNMITENIEHRGMPEYGLPNDIKRTVLPPAYEPGLFQPPPPYSARDPRSRCTIL